MDATTILLILAFFLILYCWWRSYRLEGRIIKAIENAENAQHSAYTVNADRLHDNSRTNVRIESLADRIVELEKERKLQLELAGGGVWRTQSGYTLRIRDMSTNHLQNTLKMFRARAGQQPFVAMQQELARRAEDAEWQRRTEAREKMIAEHAAECEAEEQALRLKVEQERHVLEKLQEWLKGRGGRGISVNTVRKKITELLK